MWLLWSATAIYHCTCHIFSTNGILLLICDLCGQLLPSTVLLVIASLLMGFYNWYVTSVVSYCHLLLICDLCSQLLPSGSIPRISKFASLSALIFASLLLLLICDLCGQLLPSTVVLVISSLLMGFYSLLMGFYYWYVTSVKTSGISCQHCASTTPYMILINGKVLLLRWWRNFTYESGVNMLG